MQVENDHDIMLITDGGTLVRTRVEEISLVSRNTQGVKLISLQGDEKLVGVEKIESIGEVDVSGDTPGDDESASPEDAQGEGDEGPA